MRGQASMEWLMLGLLALTLLLVAAGAVMRMQGAQAGLAERRVLQLQVQEMAYYANSICVLGEGNAQALDLAPMEFMLSYNGSGHELVMAGKGGGAQTARVACPVNVEKAGGWGTRAYLYYEPQNGRAGVRVSDRPQP
ncbi:Uncharacterised protein [uncultured archaeon]|nr:Uncharacterised protein [uncultured archaeon]